MGILPLIPGKNLSVGGGGGIQNYCAGFSISPIATDRVLLERAGWVGLGQGLTPAAIAGPHVRPSAALVPNPGFPVRRQSGLGQPPWTTP